MPKWTFHHTPGAFTVEDKQKIAKGMTDIYSSIGLPPFYSHAHFFELPEGSIFTGGVPHSHPFTTIAIAHFAGNFDSNDTRLSFMAALDAVIRPVLKPKGMDWELGIYESKRADWRINGLIPPEFGSEENKRWFEANAIVGEDEMFRQQNGVEAKKFADQWKWSAKSSGVPDARI